MSDRNPDVPQSDDPDLLASTVRLLRIVGPLGRFNVLDTIVPVVSVGDVVQGAVNVLQPTFRSNDLFTAGVQTAAAAGFRHADTLALAAGTYDVQIYIAPHATNAMAWTIAHRDNVDGFNVTRWFTLIQPGSGSGFYQVLAYEIALNERLLIFNEVAFSLGVRSFAMIFARRRT